jgi:hypothetical protein
MGYAKATGNGLDDTGAETSDENTFRVVPFTLGITYRFDYFTRKNDFLLVPYVKGGLAYYFYSVLDGNDNVARSSTGKGSGGKSGYYWALGLQLLLDIFDEGSAKTFDNEWGVNSSFLFAEYRASYVSNFEPNGIANMILDDTEQLHFGLGLEF